jgi:microcin C transport system permease protein
MLQYIGRRLLSLIPTLFGITLFSFLIINLAPGGPVEQRIRAIQFGNQPNHQGIPQEVIEAVKKQYGLDKPILERYWIWLKNIFSLNFGDSFKYQRPVVEVIAERFGVSLQFGLLSFLITYLICIPAGIFKAVKDGNYFDTLSSVFLIVVYSIPPLVLGIVLRKFLAGGAFLNWFPLGELVSDQYASLSFGEKISDRLVHFVLPLTCYVLVQFTVLTFLMKNSLLEEINLDYIRTARAKGLSERTVILKHALRNALIPIATGLSSFFTVFFAGSVIIEQIFSLRGMGLLGYEAALSRDYNVIMALIFFEGILMSIGRLLSDLSYVLIDPRIDFS